MDTSASAVLEALHEQADPVKAEHSRRFFKAGTGEYGEGDKFLGVRVPNQRRIARTFAALSLGEARKLLRSEWHEARLTSLFILIALYRKGDLATRENIFRLYLDHTTFINNWDLVDSSAHLIVGLHLDEGPTNLLDELAASDSLWERRIAMMSTYHFIKKCRFSVSLRIADTLLHDEHDLIHKIVGWMLREIGRRNMGVEETFLRSRYPEMPRTMLRYAIERFPEPRRMAYLEGRV